MAKPKLALTPKDEGDAPEDDRFEYAHGTVMIFAWIVFASTAVLFARYGRAIRFGSKEKCLGEKNWFQVHRFLACLATVATLLGFFLILVQTGAKWIGTDEGKVFVHSVLGGIIVCCALIQAWMALFRCHPDGSYRFIYNWLHRSVGAVAFLLSIPTIFIIVEQFEAYRDGLIVVISTWSVWVVCVILVLEFIQFLIRRSASEAKYRKNDSRMYDYSPRAPYIDDHPDENDFASRWNTAILALLIIHVIVSIAHAVPLIVLIWKQTDASS